jgi:hypothetical protein
MASVDWRSQSPALIVEVLKIIITPAGVMIIF